MSESLKDSSKLYLYILIFRIVNSVKNFLFSYKPISYAFKHLGILMNFGNLLK